MSAVTHAHHNPPGELPDRQDTVIAECLALMLEGRRLTGMDAVFDQHTTRLAHHVHSLGKQWGWPVSRCEKQVATADGRTASIAEYWIDDSIRERATHLGTRQWCEQVHEARARRAGYAH